MISADVGSLHGDGAKLAICGNTTAARVGGRRCGHLIEVVDVAGNLDVKGGDLMTDGAHDDVEGALGCRDTKLSADDAVHMAAEAQAEQ